MIRVSVISLIYQSAALADWVYESALKFTPMISRGQAEFLFVANDPTPPLLKHLRARGYPYVVNENLRYSDEELFELGYGAPEYMSRVYRGYNEGIRQARGDYVVLVNSDNYFSPDWLENLLKYSDRSKVVTSRLVERHHPTFGVFPGAIQGEFGGTVESFDESAFLAFAAGIRRTGMEEGGAYMPALMHRDLVLEAGLYPCGNVAGPRFDDIIRFGDEALFDSLGSLGIKHYTALDSVVYHLKEGERDDSGTDVRVANGETVVAGADRGGTPATPYPPKRAIGTIVYSLPPAKRHEFLTAAITSGQDRSTLERLDRNRLADEQTAEVLESQAQRLRALVTRLVGERLADPALAVIHVFSRFVRPLRRRLAGRKRS